MSETHTAPEHAASALEAAAEHIVSGISREAKSRSFRIANELQNSLNMVLQGQRSGRRYNIPGAARQVRRKGKTRLVRRQYTASAPGEPPAGRTGAFRGSFHRKSEIQEHPNYGFTVRGVTESALRAGKKRYLLGELLENGASRMAPRPYRQRAIDRAMPNIMRNLRQPYGR